MPCLATFTPPAAATRPEVVEMLKLWALSPPVPTISKTSIPVSTWTAWARIAAAQPAISSVVSARALLVDRAARKAAFWVGGGLAAHDLVHHGVGLVVGQVLLADDLYNGFLNHGLSSKKFFKI